MTKRKDEKKKHKDEQAEVPVADSAKVASATTAGQEAKEQKEQLDKKELLKKLQRVTADFLNYQKRIARNAEDVRVWAKAELIKGLLPIVDDFEQALEAGKNANDVESLLAGFSLVYEHLQDMLSKQQVEVVKTEGEKFDPAIHEAMLQQASADYEPGTVISELRKGYTMDGRTLRPARVSVSRETDDKETVAKNVKLPGEQ